MIKHLRRAAVFAAAIAATLPVSAGAQSAADFYKGRDLTMIVAAGAGGTYGIYARLLARFWSAHIPGNPNVVVQHMPGGGGLKGAGHLHNVVPRDGSVVGMPLQTVAMAQVLRPKQAKHDVRKWAWLGNMTVLRNTIAVWHTAPVKSLSEARGREIVIGSTGKGGDMFMVPKLANEMLGTKFKIVLGYRGISDVDKAIEAGEVQGRAGSWLSWKLQHAAWLKEGKVRQLAQVGLDRAADLKSVPLWQELATKDIDRKVLEFFGFSTQLARTVFVPGAPKAIVDALRASFEKTMQDQGLIDEAARRGVPLEPMRWDAVAKAATGTVNVDPAVLKRMKAALAK
jgi:tripartite-type tricarboxylate transporter receptor subunit TctC